MGGRVEINYWWMAMDDGEETESKTTDNQQPFCFSLITDVNGNLLYYYYIPESCGERSLLITQLATAVTYPHYSTGKNSSALLYS
mmetsp:Transcript_9283/g.17491  ORF Transcript_9283/g.17491 Transcript_9283/m.17491 type:complete len:85 (-) Transcript_9283:169-423(-)